MTEDDKRVLIFFNEKEILSTGEKRTIPQVAQVNTNKFLKMHVNADICFECLYLDSRWRTHNFLNAETIFLRDLNLQYIYEINN